MIEPTPLVLATHPLSPERFLIHNQPLQLPLVAAKWQQKPRLGPTTNGVTRHLRQLLCREFDDHVDAPQNTSHSAGPIIGVPSDAPSKAIVRSSICNCTPFILATAFNLPVVLKSFLAIIATTPEIMLRRPSKKPSQRWNWCRRKNLPASIWHRTWP